ncbi:MAG: hypothetical protein WDN48_03450 [Pseudolabrys sp.]
MPGKGARDRRRLVDDRIEIAAGRRDHLDGDFARDHPIPIRSPHRSPKITAPVVRDARKRHDGDDGDQRAAGNRIAR